MYVEQPAAPHESCVTAANQYPFETPFPAVTSATRQIVTRSPSCRACVRVPSPVWQVRTLQRPWAPTPTTPTTSPPSCSTSRGTRRRTSSPPLPPTPSTCTTHDPLSPCPSTSRHTTEGDVTSAHTWNFRLSGVRGGRVWGAGVVRSCLVLWRAA